MQCNIDAKGRAVRLLMGLGTLIAVAVVALALVMTERAVWPGWWVVLSIAALAGAFAVFEGWKGWCAVRAMGWRTPL